MSPHPDLSRSGAEKYNRVEIAFVTCDPDMISEALRATLPRGSNIFSFMKISQMSRELTRRSKVSQAIRALKQLVFDVFRRVYEFYENLSVGCR